MAKFLSRIILCSIFVVSVWSQQPPIRAPDYSLKTGSYIVVLKEGSSESNLQEVIAKIKQLSDEVLIQRFTKFIEKTVTVKISRNTLEKIWDFPEVSHIEEEDIAFGSQRKLRESRILSSFEGENLWYLDHLNITQGDNKNEASIVDVYVMDTGINFQHSEFESRAKYAGYDPVDQSNIANANYKPQRGSDCNGHGTLVASLIGGKTYGVARKTTLYSVRVLGCNQAAPWSVILDGLDFVMNKISQRKRPSIVTMAFSGFRHASMDSAIRLLQRENVLVVTSAGNARSDACNFSPASNNLALTVGSVYPNNTIYKDSNFGSCVDVFAPGDLITGASHTCLSCTVDGASGTSLAAALVSGIVAVELAHSPLIDPSKLKQKIIDISATGSIDFSLLSSHFQASTPNRLASTECGGTLEATYSGRQFIQSPNFPGNYPNSLQCTWTITAGPGEYVELKFSFIKLEEDYDFLTVTSGSSPTQLPTQLTGDYGEVYCGHVFSSNAITIEFHTDETTSSTGFQAAYKLIRGNSSAIEGCVKPLTNNILQVDLSSQGKNVGDHFSMSKDWTEFFGGRRQGLNLAVLHEDSGNLKLQETFDISSSEQASKLATTIENINPGSLVALSASGQLTSYSTLSTRTKRALSTLGSLQIENLQSSSSWALIGVKGLRPGQAIEKISNSTAVDLSTQVKLHSQRQYGIPIMVESAGTSHGNYAKIVINDIEIKNQNELGSNVGLNVVILNETSGQVIEQRLFNTHSVVADLLPSNKFADFISSLPSGRIVAIGIKGDAIAHLSESAKLACESIGSRHIRNVQIGGSWAIVGCKGAAVGTVPESASNCAAAKTLYYLSTLDNSCQISVTTSGFVNGVTQCHLGGVSSYLSVGTQVRPSNGGHTSRGITLAIVNKNTCSIDRMQTFDTFASSSASNQLVSFINAIPKSQVVMATVYNEAVNRLNDNAKTALEGIGSALIRNVAFRDAWAIIGRKGAKRGSVPETHDPNTAAIGYHIPLEAEVVSVEVHSAGTSFGNFAKILINGKTVNNGIATGLNIITLNEKRVVESKNFKTQLPATGNSLSSESFTNYIASLPVGYIVAIGIKGDAIAHLSESAKLACESIGSIYIRHVQVGESWAIVGRKGAAMGTVPETFRKDAAAKVLYYLPTLDNSCQISVTTSGYGVYGHRGLTSHISVGTQVIGYRGRGFTLAVVNENTCSIDRVQNFDTWAFSSASGQLVSVLSALPKGQVVVATVFDEASLRLKNSAKAALEGIGSALIRNVAYRDAWAIIGRKGAERGSVPEIHDLNTAAVGSHIGSSCRGNLYPLNCQAELKD